ncbi:MAG: hypothetical protein QM621_07325 [Aeromicrobium sp.]|uniref:hypothetical protein n=1 Tax=Aeromicrobium sp. TaxID=1871063 RepID=UPI0039E2FF7E
MRVPIGVFGDALFGIYFLIVGIAASRSLAYAEVPLLLVIYLCIRLWTFRDSPEMALLLIYAVSFPAMWLASRALDVQIHYLAWNVELHHFTIAFAVQGLFMSALFIALGGRIPCTIAQFGRQDDPVIYWASILGIILTMVVAVRETAETSILRQAYNFETSASSVLFEYVLILIIVAYAYSGDSRQHKWILIGASLIAIVAPMLVGRRLPGVMVGLALLLLYWRPKGLFRVLGITSVAFVALSVIGLLRVGQSGTSLGQMIFNIDSGIMRNNQGGGDYVAAVYIKLVEIGVFDSDFARRSMLNVVKSIFLPSRMVDESAYINLVATQYIPIPGNGGFPGVHLFVWAGLSGVIVGGLFLGRIMVKSATSQLASVYVTLVFLTFPRWMAYNVNILVKMGILLIIGWVIIRTVNRVAARTNAGSVGVRPDTMQSDDAHAGSAGRLSSTSAIEE